MKKIFFILMVSLLAAGGLFAELTIEPKFEAEAELKFGVDFDSPDGPNGEKDISTGFSSKATFTAGLTLRDEADEEFGEGETYGWIKIEDFEISLEAESGSGYEGYDGDKDESHYTVNDKGEKIDPVNIADDDDKGTPLVVKWGDIVAHLKFGENIYLNILSGTFDTDNMSKFGDAADGRTLNRSEFVVDPDDPTEFVKDKDDPTGYKRKISDPFAVTGSAITDGTKVALGVTNINIGGPATIELGIQSEKTYTENFDNTYGISLKVDHVIIPDLLSHDLIAVLDLNNNAGDLAKANDGDDTNDYYGGDATNIYAVGYNLTPEFSVGDFGLQIPLGIDFVYKTAGTADPEFDLAAKLAVRFDWSSMNGALDTERDTFSDSSAYDLASGVELGGRLTMEGNGDQALNTYLRIFDDEGDNGIIPILGVEALVDFDYYLAGTLKDVVDLGAGLYLDADLDIVNPYVGIAYASYDLGDVQGEVAAATGNITRTKAVFKAKVGAEVSSIIDNVTFTLDWSSGNLLAISDPKHEKYVSDSIKKGHKLGLRLDQATSSKLGQVTLGTKISF